MRSSRSAPELVMPILSAGRHRNPKRGACFMEFASYLAGEKWSDHPACTHPVLAEVARDVNDMSTDATRANLTQHIHRVVGLNGDDPLIAVSIAMHAAAAALPIASLERQRALAVGLLIALDSVDSPELTSLATDAFLSAPDAERWGRKFRSSAPSRQFTTHTALMMAHTAVVGIALACVSDADSRLNQLLVSVIDVAERLVHGPAAVSSGSEQGNAALRGQFAEV
ncbi:hypothetical protein QMG83_09930 [Salinibacterium sp. G-O1]|uniref:hypothetical protein n=1 Tax=Salinibacterium sp. G-O1 TaxID=3046208 RepID=UPI0024BAA918|nr:hypothetical protein [Salinibacterium sp. G-O1]MDJ0335540.1 hypothetical protein [Salinibacterium sp. G-O1]